MTEEDRKPHNRQRMETIVFPAKSVTIGELHSRSPSPPQTKGCGTSSNSNGDQGDSLSPDTVIGKYNNDDDTRGCGELAISKPVIHITTVPSIPTHTSSSMASMSSTTGASYDGSSGRSFPLVTEKWIRDHPEEVQQARDAEAHESDDDESVVEDYHANRDGLTSGMSYPQVLEEGDATADTRNGDSKLGKLLEKTGEKLGSDRLAEKGRKKRAGHPIPPP
ncbi:hypothetical protein M0657_005479 [Pyricularia oryzae]|nr:hypothetical protein MCOR03_008837 [Pyricularia oryzae]KAI7918069.1 hypothetical protein M9X92_007059 [Pyricularia oryzae]KAI7922719.1 hypothetical protein M0657_005479 [Pyricularia oryzae]QBZ59715.1 hypothetical protein PoMZ_04678 [Pyricularia oryzae]